jgi:hypothetical protein
MLALTPGVPLLVVDHSDASGTALTAPLPVYACCARPSPSPAEARRLVWLMTRDEPIGHPCGRSEALDPRETGLGSSLKRMMELSTISNRSTETPKFH